MSFAIMNDVDYVLYANIPQVMADAKAAEVWSDSSRAKTQLWLTGDDTSTSYQAISGWIDGLEAKYGADSSTNKASDPAGFAKDMQEHCPYTGTDPSLSDFTLDHWNSNLVVKLQMLITKIDDGSEWNPVVGAVGPFGNMISSSMTQATTIAETEGRNLQSQLSTDNSANQPVADFGSTNSQNWCLNVLAQMSPA